MFKTRKLLENNTELIGQDQIINFIENPEQTIDSLIKTKKEAYKNAGKRIENYTNSIKNNEVEINKNEQVIYDCDKRLIKGENKNSVIEGLLSGGIVVFVISALALMTAGISGAVLGSLMATLEVLKITLPIAGGTLIADICLKHAINKYDTIMANKQKASRVVFDLNKENQGFQDAIEKDKSLQNKLLSEIAQLEDLRTQVTQQLGQQEPLTDCRLIQNTQTQQLDIIKEKIKNAAQKYIQENNLIANNADSIYEK